MIKLPTKIDSDLDVRNLENIFDDMTTSYKAYWFLGVFEEIIHGNKVISFKNITLKMISNAWYPLLNYHLNFGAMDKLSEIIKKINSTYINDINISPNNLYKSLNSISNNDFENLISYFYKYVPYRLLTPFFSSELRGLKDALKNKTIEDLSLKDSSCLYKIYSRDKKIIVNDSWFEYITKNQNIIKGWLNYKLILFLQKKNPSVPAIPLKLQPPIKRDLSTATKFWNKVISNIGCKDIYTNLAFTDKNYNNLGSLSIDHFIPWSFVLHDELWNLIPTFTNINSSKNDSLPCFNDYFNKFSELQYKAVNFMRKEKSNKKFLEEYLSISSKLDINSLLSVEYEINIDIFKKDLLNTINPLYQIAYNQGYSEWKLNKDYVSHKGILLPQTHSIF